MMSFPEQYSIAEIELNRKVVKISENNIFVFLFHLPLLGKLRVCLL